MEPGNLVGKYRLLAALGHGGMADVHLAVAQGPAGFNKLLVVKELRPALAQDPDFLDMFMDEARLAARLSHPNVVQTYEASGGDGRYFIAMEYLDGQPLNRIVAQFAKKEGLPWPVGLRVVCEALSGLHYAHELRDYDGQALAVVHRDVTPHNLFVTYDGQVKLVDFGIAKAVGSSAETRIGMLKGKVGYMAPEQARGEEVDRRTDVYGMGVIVWEILARRRMWRATPDVLILSRLAANDLPSLASAGGTRGSVANAIFSGFGAGLDLRDQRTAVDIRSSLFWGNLEYDLAYPERGGPSPATQDDDQGFDEAKFLLEPARQNAAARRMFPGCAHASNGNFGPERALSEQAATPPDDEFFDPHAAYIGAFRDRNDAWAQAAWARWD